MSLWYPLKALLVHCREATHSRQYAVHMPLENKLHYWVIDMAVLPHTHYYHHQFNFHNELARHNTHRKNNSERLPEKRQGSMNWPPITVLNVTNYSAKIKKIDIMIKIFSLSNNSVTEHNNILEMHGKA